MNRYLPNIGSREKSILQAVLIGGSSAEHTIKTHSDSPSLLGLISGRDV